MLDDRQMELAARLVEEDVAVRYSYAKEPYRNPAANYTDPARFEAERNALFLNRPVFAGLSAECAKPGAYFTRDIGGMPIAVVRQADGSLRAFVNICRHRAAPLLSGSGEKRRFMVCPYHAWTYNLKGELVNTPQAHGGFDEVKENCNLLQRAVAEKHGLIFVHATSDAPFEVDDQLHGMQSEFANFGIPDAHHIETRETKWKMNWKMLIDTFLEAYHVPYLHKETIDPTHASYQIYDSFGKSLRIVGLRKIIMNQFTEMPRESWRLFPNATFVYVIVPNALLIYQGDHVETWRVEPIDADNCRAYFSIFSPEAPKTEKAMSYWMRNLERMCEVACKEDFPVQEQIYANLRTGALPEVIYGKNEPALQEFHKIVNAAVAEYQDGAQPH